jgi:hypothetical protein
MAKYLSSVSHMLGGQGRAKDRADIGVEVFDAR